MHEQLGGRVLLEIVYVEFPAAFGAPDTGRVQVGWDEKLFNLRCHRPGEEILEVLLRHNRDGGGFVEACDGGFVTLLVLSATENFHR
jgi:hypothetical protein